MLIADLPYFESISSNKLVLGGAYLKITADASGNYALTDTDVDLRIKKNKIKAKGKGTALAIGEDPYANVDVYYGGFDSVRVKTKTKTKKNYVLETVKVKAK